MANDELLTKYLAKNKRTVLNDIIATIQQEQNEIIRKRPQDNVIVQGGAGSGKTTVAMHRISYIFTTKIWNFSQRISTLLKQPDSFELYHGDSAGSDVYGVSQMTMEQLLHRLLYEDWMTRSIPLKNWIGRIKQPV